MIKTKDGYLKLIGTKYSGNQYYLLGSDGNVWEVHDKINNSPNKLVRTDNEGVLPAGIITIKDNIQLDKTAYIHRVGVSGAINKGRDTAAFRVTSYYNNSALFSIKSNSGSWDMSVASNSLNLHYITDGYYSGNSSTFNTLTFPNKTGIIATTLDIPTINMVAGISKANVSSSLKDPYLVLSAKTKDITGTDVFKYLGQVKIQGVGSTIVNSSTNNSVIISTTLYKAGSGLEETSTPASSITGYTTTTLSVNLGYVSNEDKYAVQNHSSGLYVQVPWRPIAINDVSIKQTNLNLKAGTNITLSKDQIVGTNETTEVTITAKDTTYEFEGGTESFQVSVSGGSAKTIKVTPSSDTVKYTGTVNINNIAVFSNNSGAIKDSGKAIGNAQNNVPLNNKTLNSDLNADLWDGYHLSVKTSMPSSPSANTIYFII